VGHKREGGTEGSASESRGWLGGGGGGGRGGGGGTHVITLLTDSTEATSAFCHAIVYFHLNIGIIMTASIIVQMCCQNT